MLRVLAFVAPILLVDWLLIVFVGPNSGSKWWKPILVGLVFGSMFGQTTLAATAIVFLRAPLALRLPVSVFWVFMLGAGLALNVGLNGGPSDMGFVFGALVFAQWLVLQLLLWPIRFAFAIKLSHIQSEPSVSDPSRHQFGIRQLMIVTAAVGVLLGVGRVMVPVLIDRLSVLRHDLPVHAFLVVAEVILTLPLVLAALLRRFTFVGTLLALAFVAGATFVEVPLLQLLAGNNGIETSDFVGVNAVASALVTAALTAVRMNGYSLATSCGGAKN